MRADHDVDGTRAQTVDGLLLLGRGPESREQTDPHLHRGESLTERLKVLLREHSRRDEHGDLMPRHHRLERRANGDLGFAVADIADNETVHRLGDS